MQKSQELVQRDGENQKFLNALIKHGVLELKPTLNKEGVHYFEAEKTLKDTDSAGVKTVLQNLEKKGVLESKFFDRVLTCPECDSPEVYSKYACPKCDSYNVEYTELLEHIKCGYIGSRDKFMKDSSLVCPGCQAILTEEAVTYRVIGNCYQCEKCGYRFDAPEIVHFCQQCQRSFNYQEAKYIKIYAYKITDETINKFGRDLPLLETVGEILRENGFTIQFHTQITGVSGVQHTFDIVAKKGEVHLVIDVSLAGNKSDAVSLLGKKMDVNPTESLLIDLSDLEELTPLGKVYGITVFKGVDEKKLENALQSFLTTL